MRTVGIATLACATAPSAHAETESFDAIKPGGIPDGWTGGVTGKGSPKWAVGEEPSAPSPKQVLQQTGSGTFPWCVKNSTDGRITGAGAVGVWTKADSVTAFDDFTSGGKP